MPRYSKLGTCSEIFYNSEPVVFSILGIKLDEIPIMVADVEDKENLVAMAKQAKVILNCVGPVSANDLSYILKNFV